MAHQENKTLLIIGCGYLGGFVVDRAQGIYQKTVAVVRSSKRLEHLQSKRSEIQIVDVFGERVAYNSLGVVPPFDVIFMIPPSAIGRDVGGVKPAMRNVIEDLERHSCSKALLISSTGIYGNPENEIVTAETLPLPSGVRGERLAAIEEAWLSGGARFSVLRLAGIYGPARVIGQRALAEGEPIGGRSEAWLNLIHVQDAASLSIRCLSGDAEKIELGSDNHPIRRKDYYNHVAAVLGYPSVKFEDNTSSRMTSYPTRTSNGKRCDPSSTYRRLQWRPQFEDYVLGLRDALELTQENEE